MLDEPLFLFIFLSFVSNFILLAFYFSSVVGGRGSRRGNSLNAPGIMTSLLGGIVATGFSLLSPIIPSAVPLMDLSVLLAAFTWLILLRRFCGTGWFETLPQVILAAIVYVIVVAAASAFSILLLS